MRKELEDLYFAVKRYLINEGREENIAKIVAARAYNQVGIIIAVREWGRIYEKNLRKMWQAR